MSDKKLTECPLNQNFISENFGTHFYQKYKKEIHRIPSKPVFISDKYSEYVLIKNIRQETHRIPLKPKSKSGNFINAFIYNSRFSQRKTY